MKKRIFSLVLVLALMLSLMPAAFAANESLDNFQKVNEYTSGQFSDIVESKWYAANVQLAYELGLVQGSSATSFNPDGNISIAETLALACRLHSIYNTGSAEFTQVKPWYQVYVDYAVENNIITADQFGDYKAKATRAQFATILAASLPESALTAINDIALGDIHDVSSDAAYAKSVYLLYNAGILTGSDDNGSFKPDSNIKRSEVAAIVTRMADADTRKFVDLVYVELMNALQGQWVIKDGDKVIGDLTIDGTEYSFTYITSVSYVKQNGSFALDGYTATATFEGYEGYIYEKTFAYGKKVSYSFEPYYIDVGGVDLIYFLNFEFERTASKESSTAAAVDAQIAASRQVEADLAVVYDVLMPMSDASIENLATVFYLSYASELFTQYESSRDASLYEDIEICVEATKNSAISAQKYIQNSIKSCGDIEYTADIKTALEGANSSYQKLIDLELSKDTIDEYTYILSNISKVLMDVALKIETLMKT